jgi:hypothetical protein
VRIEEPLAAMMEGYAQFLGTANVDHVIAEALAFVFKKDTEFKDWLSSHPAPPPKETTHKGKPNGTAAAQDAPKSQHATAGSAI